MKKVLIAVLTLTMLLAVTANAMAVTFTLPVPCEAIADNQLYKYCASVFEYKGGSDHKIFVSHHVTQTSAVETNRIAAYSDLTKKRWVQTGTVQILDFTSACPMQVLLVVNIPLPVVVTQIIRASMV